MKEKRFYDREFKANAFQLSNQRDDIASLAGELGITTKLLYSWHSESRKKGFRYHLRGRRLIIYHFINTHKDKWSVEMMCKVLEVSSSAYCTWRKEPYGKRYKHSSRIQGDIKKIYFAVKGRYGSPHIAKEMESRGIKLSRRTVAKYMKEIGLKSKLSCKYRSAVDYSHKEPVAENILNRDFIAKYPGIKCVSDITYLPVNHCFAYLAVVIDLFDRQPIGWTISDCMTAAEIIILPSKRQWGTENCSQTCSFTLIEVCNMLVKLRSITSNPTTSTNR